MNKFKFISKSKPEPFIRSGYNTGFIDKRPLNVSIKIDKKNGVFIPKDLVYALFGSEWPEFKMGGSEFNWNSVSHFELYDGELVPCDGEGEFIPAPNLKLVMTDLELIW